jgi:hypothetical protein
MSGLVIATILALVAMHFAAGFAYASPASQQVLQVTYYFLPG